MSVSKAFHDFVNKGLFVANTHGLFFIPDEELDRVGYDPVHHGCSPIQTGELSRLMVNDHDNWIRTNLKQIGYLI